MAESIGLVINLENFEGFEKSIKNLEKVVARIDTNINTLGNGFDKLEGYMNKTKGFADNLRLSVNEVNEVFNQLKSNVDKLDIKGDFSGLTAIVDSFTDFATKMGKVNLPEDIQARMTAMTEALSKVARLKQETLSGIGTGLGSLATGLNNVAKVKHEKLQAVLTTITGIDNEKFEQIVSSMAKFEEVNAAKLTEVSTALGTLITELGKIPKATANDFLTKFASSLEKISKNPVATRTITAFSAALRDLGTIDVTNLPAITAFVTSVGVSIKSLSAKNTEALKTIAGSLKAIALSFQEFSKLPDMKVLTSVASFITKVNTSAAGLKKSSGDAMRQLAAGINTLSTATQAFKADLDIVKFIDKLIAASAKLTADVAKDMRALAGGINTLSAATVSFKPDDKILTFMERTITMSATLNKDAVKLFRDMASGMKGLALGLATFNESLAKFDQAKSHQMLAFFHHLAPILIQIHAGKGHLAISAIGRAIPELSKAIAIFDAAKAPDLIAFLQTFTNFLVTVPKEAQSAARAISTIVNAMRLMFETLKQFTITSGTTTKKRGGLTGMIFGGTVTEATFTQEINGLLLFTRKLIDALAEVEKVIRRPERLRAVATGVNAIRQLFDSIRLIADPKGANMSFSDVQLQAFGAIEKFAEVAAKAIKSFEKIRRAGSVRAVSGSIRSIAEVLEAIAAIKKIPSLENIELQQTMFEKLTGRGGLSKLIPNFVGFTKIIKKGLEQLGDIPEPGRFRAISEVMSGIAEFLASFTKALPEIVIPNEGMLSKLFSQRIADDFKKLPKVFKVLAKAIDEISKVKIREGRVDLAVIAKLLESMAKILPKLDDLGSLKSFKGEVLKRIGPALAGLVKQIAKVASSIKDVNLDKAIKVADIINKLANALQRLANAKNVANISEDLDKILETLGKNVTEGFVTGLKSGSIEKQGAQFGADFVGGLKKFLKISSPSRLMIDIGKDVIAGFVLGLKAVNLAVQGIKAGYDFAKAVIKGAIDGFQFFGPSLWREVDRIAERVTNSLTQAARNVRNTGRNLVQSGIQDVLFGGVAGFMQGRQTDLVATFDQVVNQIRVFGKLSIEQMEAVQDAVLKFSAETVFNPQQSADAMLGLLKAGLTAADALKVLPEVGALAAAGQISLDAATQLTISSMQTFGLEVGEATRITNGFVAAADISTATVEGVGSAFSYAAPGAAALGVSIEELNAAIALFADRGLVGERAGTGLRAVLDSLAAPTAQAKAQLDALGVRIFDTQGNFVGLSNVVHDLQDALGGLTKEQQFAALGELGDRNAITALITLLDEGTGGMIELADGTKVAASAFDEYFMRLGEANDAQTVAASLMDTFKGSIESLKGSLDVLIIKTLQPFSNKVLKPIIDGLIEFINVLSQLPEPVLMAVASFVAMGTAIITLGGLFKIFSGLALSAVAPFMQAVAGALRVYKLYVFNLATLITTIAPYLALFTALVPIFVALGAAIAFIGTGINYLYRVIKSNAGGSLDAIQRTINTVKEFISTIEDVFTRLGLLFDYIIRQVTKTAEHSGLIKEGFNLAGSAVAAFFDKITDAVEDAINGLNEFIEILDVVLLTVGVDVPVFEEGRSPADKVEEETARLFGVGDKLKKAQEENERLTGEYLVQAGDTLWDIAQKYGTTVDAIVEANNIRDRNLILPGQTLVIPVEGVDVVDEEGKPVKSKIDKVFDTIAIASGKKRIDVPFGLMTKDVEENTEVLNDNAEAVSNVNEQQSKLIEATEKLRGNKLFQKIFGDFDKGAQIKLVGTLFLVQFQIANIIRLVDELGLAFTYIITGDFKKGMDTAQTAFGNLAASILSTFEIVSGIDIADKIIDKLQVGDISGAIDSFLKQFNKPIERMLTTLADLTADFIAHRFRFLVGDVFLGVTDFVLGVIGVSGVRQKLLPFVDFLSEIIHSVVRSFFDLLLGRDTILGRFGRIIAAIVDQITGAFASIASGETTLMDVLWKAISATGLNIPIEALYEAASMIVSTLFDGISQAIGYKDFGGLVNDMVAGLELAVGAFFDIGADFAEMLISGFEDLLGISSPSTQFAKKGDDIADGLIVGLLRSLPRVLGAMFEYAVQMGATLVNNIGKGLDLGSSLFTNLTKSIDTSSFENIVLSVLGVNTAFKKLQTTPITKAFNALRKSFDALSKAFSRFLNNRLFQRIAEQFNIGYDAINEFLFGAEKVEGVADSFNGMFEFQFEDTGEGLAGVADGMRDFSRQLKDAKDAPFAIRAIATAFDALSYAVQGIGLGLDGLTILLNFIDAIVFQSGAAASILEGIGVAISGIVAAVSGVTTTIFTDIKDFIHEMSNLSPEQTEQFRSAMGELSTAFNELWLALVKFSENDLFGLVADGAREAYEAISGLFGGDQAVSTDDSMGGWGAGVQRIQTAFAEAESNDVPGFVKILTGAIDALKIAVNGLTIAVGILTILLNGLAVILEGAYKITAALGGLLVRVSAPVIRDFADAVSALARAVEDLVVSDGKLDTSNLIIIASVIAGIALYGGSAAGITITLAGAVNLLSAGVLSLSLSLQSFLWIAIGVAGTIALVFIAVVFAINLVKRAAEPLADLIEGFGDFLDAFVKLDVKGMGEAWEKINDSFVRLIEAILAAGIDTFATLLEVLSELVIAVTDFAGVDFNEGNVESFIELLRALADVIGEEGIVEAVSRLSEATGLSDLFRSIGEGAENAISGLRQDTTDAWADIHASINLYILGIRMSLLELIAVIAEKVAELLNKIPGGSDFGIGDFADDVRKDIKSLSQEKQEIELEMKVRGVDVADTADEIVTNLKDGIEKGLDTVDLLSIIERDVQALGAENIDLPTLSANLMAMDIDDTQRIQFANEIAGTIYQTSEDPNVIAAAEQLVTDVLAQAFESGTLDSPLDLANLLDASVRGLDVPNIWEFMETDPEQAKEFLLDLRDDLESGDVKFEQLGKTLQEGITGGLLDALPDAEADATEFVQSIKDTIAGPDGFDSQSPSRWGMEQGLYLSMGIAGGILAGIPLIGMAAMGIVAIMEVLNAEAVKVGQNIGDSILQGAMNFSIAAVIIQGAAVLMILALQNVAAVAAQVAETLGGITVPTAGGAPPPPPTGARRAQGGSVVGRGIYKIAEPNLGVPRPEVFTDSSGNQYLIPGSNGMVTPLRNANSMAGGGGTVFNQNISITVTNTGDGVDIERRIQRGIERANRSNPFLNRARVRGKI